MDLDTLVRYPMGPVEMPKNGQVVIPAPIRTALGLDQGSVVYFRLDANPPTAIVIVPGPTAVQAPLP